MVDYAAVQSDECPNRTARPERPFPGGPAKEGSRPLTKEVDNSVAGFRELRDLARKAKATVCVEPTGGYELTL